MSGTEGSRTRTGVNRRSRAGSFSMCWRYSSWVVAPMHGNSPRPRAALSSLAASWGPSPVEPAPMMVWISSMKTTTRPPALRTSSLMPRSFSEKAPRSCVPATTPAMSISTSTRPARAGPDRGVASPRAPASPRPAPSRSLCAIPSTMAVLPTPGSPMRSGLFVRRLPRTSIASSTSRSRPTSGSSFPAAASSVRFRPSCDSQGNSVGSRAWGERSVRGVRAAAAAAGARACAAGGTAAGRVVEPGVPVAAEFGASSSSASPSSPAAASSCSIAFSSWSSSARSDSAAAAASSTEPGGPVCAPTRRIAGASRWAFVTWTGWSSFRRRGMRAVK